MKGVWRWEDGRVLKNRMIGIQFSTNAPVQEQETHLVVTTTVGVVDGVHSNTTSTRPRVALGTHGVVLATGLEEGLVDTATAGGDTNGSTSARRDGLLGTRGETDASLAVLRVANDGGVVARGTGKGSAVTDLLLNVEDDGTLGALTEGKNVADREGSLLTGVDERAGRDTLSRDEGLLAELVAVGVAEDDGGKGSATAGSANVPRKSSRSTFSTVSSPPPRHSAENPHPDPSQQPPPVPALPSHPASHLHRRSVDPFRPKFRPPVHHSPASVVDDLPHDTTDVAVLLSKVEVAETSRVLVVVRVGLEDPTRLPLGTNDTLDVSQHSHRYRGSRNRSFARADKTYTHLLRTVSNALGDGLVVFLRTGFFGLEG